MVLSKKLRETLFRGICVTLRVHKPQGLPDFRSFAPIFNNLWRKNKDIDVADANACQNQQTKNCQKHAWCGTYFRGRLRQFSFGQA